MFLHIIPRVLEWGTAATWKHVTITVLEHFGSCDHFIPSSCSSCLELADLFVIILQLNREQFDKAWLINYWPAPKESGKPQAGLSEHLGRKAKGPAGVRRLLTFTLTSQQAWSLTDRGLLIRSFPAFPLFLGQCDSSNQIQTRQNTEFEGKISKLQKLWRTW